MKSALGPAVVLGLNPNALATVRALARAGIEVVAMGPTPGASADSLNEMSARTRLARVIHVPRAQWPAALPEALLRAASTWSGRAVLIPSGDAQVETLLTHRDALSGSFEIVLSDAELTRTLVDKVTFSRIATERGVPVPRTLTGLTPESVARTAGDIRFPCIIKPAVRDHVWDNRFGINKVLECRDAASFHDNMALAFEDHSSLIVQEVVPGTDDRIVFSHVYIGRDGRELAMWTGRKLRQHPIHYGSATLATTEWMPEIAELTRRLLGNCGFAGYASVEFKYDGRDGTAKVLEATVGRTCYHHGLGLAANVNIPELWYRDALGLPTTPAPRQKDGVVWMDEYRDLAAAMDYRRVGELDLGSWIRSFRGRRTYAHLSLKDPMPGVLLGARLLSGAARLAMRKAASIVGK